MYATVESVELIDQAESLSMMILDSDVAEKYYHCLYKVRSDKKAQTLIRQFVDIKDNYDDVQRFGKYHPDFDKITSEVRQLKRQLDLNETIASFKKAEQDLQSLLDEISVMVGKSVSEFIKVPTGNPFFDSMSACGGGCGTGGGCGCS